MGGRYRLRVPVRGPTLGFQCEDQVQIEGVGVSTQFKSWWCPGSVRAGLLFSPTPTNRFWEPGLLFLLVCVSDTAFVFISATSVL